MLSCVPEELVSPELLVDGLVEELDEDGLVEELDEEGLVEELEDDGLYDELLEDDGLELLMLPELPELPASPVLLELPDEPDEPDVPDELPPETPSALNVCESSCPLPEMFCCCWNFSSACLVSGPILPSTFTWKPFSVSACWASRTSLEPCWLELDGLDCEPMLDVSFEDDEVSAAYAPVAASTKAAIIVLRNFMWSPFLWV